MAVPLDAPDDRAVNPAGGALPIVGAAVVGSAALGTAPIGVGSDLAGDDAVILDRTVVR